MRQLRPSLTPAVLILTAPRLARAQSICFLQHENGLEVGDRLHGRQSASTALETIYAVQRDQTSLFLTTPNAHTKRRPYVGIAADKVCDKQFASWEVANGRVNYAGTPVVFALELRPIESYLLLWPSWQPSWPVQSAPGCTPQRGRRPPTDFQTGSQPWGRA